jgi:hypothetical protein
LACIKKIQVLSFKESISLPETSDPFPPSSPPKAAHAQSAGLTDTFLFLIIIP